MSSAVQNAIITRRCARELIAREERETGSLMTAYANVARAVGTSASWLRKFIKGYEAKEPGWTVAWNIIDHYSRVYGRVCDRVELQNEQERGKFKALKDQADAIAATFEGMDDAALSTMEGGAASDEFDQTEWP